MRTIYFRAVAVAFAAAFALTAAASGQQPAPGILAAPQVREAVAGQQPADHAKLRAHFEALAARYDADARQHTAFAQAYAGNSRGGAAAAAHHNRLAEAAKESAGIVRQLSTHHGQLGAGVTSTPPKGGERFERGAGAPATPTRQQLLVLAARAQTPTEHGQLAEYYSMQIAGYQADARDHRAMAQGYQGLNRPNVAAVAHCERLVALANDAVKETQALIDEHRKLATGR